jgi:hypothetical protein
MRGEMTVRKYGVARNLLLLPVILLLGGLLPRLERLAIPAAELIDPIWAEHDDSNELTVDHRAWDRFLKKYLETDAAGINRVAYARISPADRAMTECLPQAARQSASAKIGSPGTAGILDQSLSC